MRVLVVEDDRKTAAFIARALADSGFAVTSLDNGDAALEAITTAPCDVVVLDVMLPGRDGLSVVRQARKRNVKTPILLLSARGALDERVEGLDAGADDYLAKPFALEELLARVRALARRSDESPASVLKVADLVLDTHARSARRGDREIELTAKEFALLRMLMRAPGRVQGRMAILQEVWDYGFDPGSNVVDVYVRKLRSKIDDGFPTKLLHTVRGVGYVLREPS